MLKKNIFKSRNSFQITVFLFLGFLTFGMILIGLLYGNLRNKETTSIPKSPTKTQPKTEVVTARNSPTPNHSEKIDVIFAIPENYHQGKYVKEFGITVDRPEKEGEFIVPPLGTLWMATVEIDENVYEVRITGAFGMYCETFGSVKKTDCTKHEEQFPHSSGLIIWRTAQGETYAINTMDLKIEQYTTDVILVRKGDDALFTEDEVQMWREILQQVSIKSNSNTKAEQASFN